MSEPAWNPDLYDAKHAFVWQHGAALIDLLAPRSGERILDLGSGTGHLTSQIAQAGAEVIGVDHSLEMIAQAQERYPHLRFEHADARNLPFAGEFDAVFSNAVLHWVKEADRAALSIAKALKPGGRFVAEFGGQGNVQKIEAALQRACRSILKQDVASPWYFPSIADYAAVLHNAGLEATFAHLFDRMTPLEGEAGLRNWIAMFGRPYRDLVPAPQHDAFFTSIEAELRPTLHRDGIWHADYRRLRIVAFRP